MIAELRRNVIRMAFAVPLFLSLAACVTLPEREGFTARQIEVLEGAGFRPVGSGYELGISNRVLFGFDSASIVPETATMLAGLSRQLLAAEIYGAGIVGHTDAVGEDEYNVRLSRSRAAAVRDALLAGGMDPSRMRVDGLGESDPIETNDTEAGRMQNRRVVIIVTPADALPVGR